VQSNGTDRPGWTNTEMGQQFVLYVKFRVTPDIKCRSLWPSVLRGKFMAVFVAGILGSNLVEGMDVCLLCLLCCVPSVLLCRADLPSTEVLHFVCV
jgi:hypothetical protein